MSCVDNRSQSGLTKECLEAQYNIHQVEALALQYLQTWVPDAGIAMLAGSSVYADRSFLVESMPTLVKHLHYRYAHTSRQNARLSGSLHVQACWYVLNSTAFQESG